MMQKRPLWMNAQTLEKIKKKSFAFKRYLKSREVKDYYENTKVRNQANYAIKWAKRHFMKKIAESSKIQRQFINMQKAS